MSNDLTGVTVYVAAPFAEKEEARKVRSLLMEKGIEVTSRWIDSHIEPYETITPEQEQTNALQDLEDVMGADVFVLLDYYPPSKGRATELGFALGVGKPCVVVGGSRNLFNRLTINVDTVSDLLDTVDGWEVVDAAAQ